jgi:hypothetical protein
MLKRTLLVLFICASFFMAKSQVVVYINAGSRAHYGTTQELFIDANGQARYWKRNVNGPGIDSSVFNLTRPQLDSFFQKATQVGFFSLNATYEKSNLVDGSGILISVNHAGQKKSVSVRNQDLPAINELITWLNTILAPQRLRIYYFNPTPSNK